MAKIKLPEPPPQHPRPYERCSCKFYCPDCAAIKPITVIQLDK